MLDETRPKANHVAGTRRWAGALVLGGALAVLAAALLGLSLRASSTTQAGQPRTEPRTLHPTGDFKHPSGFPMPERVGPFQRVEVTQYDEAGLNLSAGYNRLPGEGDPWPIAATVYVYPVRPGVELDAAFEKLLGDLGQMHGGAKPEFRKNILLGDERLVGRYAIFGYEEPWGGLKEHPPPLVRRPLRVEGLLGEMARHDTRPREPRAHAGDRGAHRDPGAPARRVRYAEPPSVRNRDTQLA